MTKLIKKAQKGETISSLYERKTGKPWNAAKKEGLTSGSYEDNMKLKQLLLSGKFDNKQSTVSKQSNIKNNTTIQNQDYTKAKDFNEAFFSFKDHVLDSLTIGINGVLIL